MTAPTHDDVHDDVHDDAVADLAVALAAMLRRDALPPCCDGTGRWLSEDPQARAQAAQECAGCPLAEPCGAAGAERTFGVWGGVDVSTRPSRRRPRAHDTDRPVVTA